nr:integrin alpha-10-like [Microcebus murinus]
MFVLNEPSRDLFPLLPPGQYPSTSLFPITISLLLGCPTYMDVVIVLDGSNSIYPWSEVQTFLRRLVGRLFIDPEQIQVGLVQYGESPVHEWSLGDFRTKEEVVRAARNLSRREGRETKTAEAIMMAW